MSPDDPDLSALIRRHATRHAAPDALRAGIRTQLALADAGRAAPAAGEQRRWRAIGVGIGFGSGLGFGSERRFAWRTALSGFALGIACALLVVPLWPRLGEHEPTDAELVADHVRALGPGPLIEVASSDRHTVKPWFQGQLDYAPAVFDLGADGFPLLGGRVERVGGHAVAALAYRRDRHVIDVFVLPGTGPQGEPAAQAASAAPPLHSLQRGFNVLRWADGAMSYVAVSDLERAEMERFVLHWQAHAAAH